MVVSSEDAATHEVDLAELFSTINRYGIKLNPDKCVFRVNGGKFLGFLITHRGIEARLQTKIHTNVST